MIVDVKRKVTIREVQLVRRDVQARVRGPVEGLTEVVLKEIGKIQFVHLGSWVHNTRWMMWSKMTMVHKIPWDLDGHTRCRKSAIKGYLVGKMPLRWSNLHSWMWRKSLWTRNRSGWFVE